MTLQLLLTLSTFSVVALEGLFVVTMFLHRKNLEHISFMAFCVFSIINAGVIYLQSSTELAYPLISRLILPFSFSRYPLFYLYTRSLMEPNFRLNKKSIKHMIPFFVGILWITVATLRREHPWRQITLEEYKFEIYIDLFISWIFFVIYIIALRARWMEFRERMKEVTSNANDLRTGWVSTILYVFYFMAFLHTIAILAGPRAEFWRFQSVWITMGLFIMLISALRHSRSLFPQIKVPNVPSISEEKLDEMKRKLMAVLDSQKLFLDPSLRLNQLAEALGLRENQTSQIIRQGLRTSFYDLINSKRIEYAKSIMSSPDKAFMNLLGIATESGFNSKSVFNEAFKKYTGMTPSAYRTTLISGNRAQFPV